MSFYIETVKRKSGTRYRIVRDITRDGRRKRTYHSLPAGTTKDTAKKICCEMNLNAEFGDFMQNEINAVQRICGGYIFPNIRSTCLQLPSRCTSRCIRPKMGFGIPLVIIR